MLGVFFILSHQQHVSDIIFFSFKKGRDIHDRTRELYNRLAWRKYISLWKPCYVANRRAQRHHASVVHVPSSKSFDSVKYPKNSGYKGTNLYNSYFAQPFDRIRHGQSTILIDGDNAYLRYIERVMIHAVRHGRW